MVVCYEGAQRFTVETRGHEIIVDLPPDLGGTDEGMTPPELFAASLGACIGVYAVSYMQKAGLPTDGLRIEVSYESSDEPVKRIEALRALICIPHVLSEEGRAAVLRAAEKCMIHNTLRYPPSVEIELA